MIHVIKVIFLVYLAHFAFSDRIHNNPDVYRTTPELIESRGFLWEQHWVTTEDGYVLGVFRVKNPRLNVKPKPKPVLMWHQMLFNSNQLLISSQGYLDKNGNYKEYNGAFNCDCKYKLTSNLVFTLAACGWDVWLGNSRGNRYSDAHVKYSTKDTEYWNYTFTELALYDTKNTIEYILDQTNQSSLSYIGSSLSTTQMFVLLSLRPEFERHITPFIAEPPVAFMSHTRSLFRYIAPFLPLVNKITFGFTIPRSVMAPVGHFLCTYFTFRPICQEIIFSFVGRNYLLTDRLTIPLLVANAFDQISVRIPFQYGQFILDGHFHQFDFMDTKTNMRYYGNDQAPLYPLENITSKNIILYSAANDFLAEKEDVQQLVDEMKVQPLEHIEIPHNLFNHFDFVFGKYNNFYLNFRIIKHLESFQNS